MKLPNPRPNNGSVPLDLAWIRSNTRPHDECWLWLGSVDRKGYGHVRTGTKNSRVHTVAYELAVGAVPSGLMLDHVCRNPSCCNPAHLEPVTNQENVRRGRSLVYVGGTCPRCGSARLFEARWGHRCADCLRGYEQRPERVAARAEYERKRAQTDARKAQHRAACARYNARKRLTDTEGT
jgi:hypothetical protein